MFDLRELYQEVIIDHNRNPRNHYAMNDASFQANGANPLCGDKLTVYVQMNDDTIESVSFVGCGCAISQASASLMTEAITGLSRAKADSLFDNFHRMLTTDDESDALKLSKLDVLSGVRAYPARVKCATLAWHTLQAALAQDNRVISTE